MQLGRGSDARHRMRVGLHLPQQLAVLRIHSVDVRLHVAEVSGVAAVGDRPERDGAAHRGRRSKRPVAAAGGGIERIDGAVRRAEKQAAVCDCGLPVRNRGIGNPEGPFQFQLGNLRGSESGGLCGLEARVFQIDSPAVPSRDVCEPGCRPGTLAAARSFRRHGRFRQKIHYRRSLGRAQHGGLRLHRALLERVGDLLARHLRENFGQRRARLAPGPMTRNAMFPK